MSLRPDAWARQASPTGAHLLLADLLRQGHPASLRAFGLSMLPSLWPGATLHITPAPFQPPLTPGDLLLTLHRDRLRVHRLVAIPTPNRYITKGDFALRADPACEGVDLLGRVTRINQRPCAPAASSRAARTWAAASLGLAFCAARAARAARSLGLRAAPQTTP